jgi:hypothetical protein
MRRVFPTCLLAFVFAAVAAAQDAKIETKTTIDADDAKAVVVTGCLAGGPTSFTLSNIAPADASIARERRADAPVGTSGAIAMYQLTAREGVNLTTHVGQRVQITGAALKASRDKDDDAEVTVKEETRVDLEDGRDSKAETRTRVEVPKGSSPKLLVTSVKMVSTSCQ